MRILIAEDDLTSRTVLKTVLERLGHEVIVTVNGEDAWNVITMPDPPRMAILDWMMPRMDGLEVVRRIRASSSMETSYIILLTARSEKTDMIKGFDAGVDDYLSKPFDAGELRARVEVGRRMIGMHDRLAAQVQELQKALEEIKTLQGIIPICSYCKKIRDDQGYWSQVEDYISHHSDMQFSHSICPACLKKHYPDFS